MKALSKNLQSIKQAVSELYYASLNNIKKVKKSNKKYIKSMEKEVSTYIFNLKESSSFFNSFNICSYEQNFLFESLELSPGLNPIKYLKYLDVQELLKDKDFTTFLRTIILTELMYKMIPNKDDDIHQTNYFKNLQIYFGDIRKVFLSYFLLKKRNITLIQVQHIASYIFKGSDFYPNILNIPKNKQNLLQQIITGVKYETLKPGLENNLESRAYNERGKFDILEKVSKTIKVHYFTGKNGKHSYHESPITHVRKGHYRTYKCGKKVWIPEMTINESGRVP